MSSLDVDKRKTCPVLIDLQQGITSMNSEPYEHGHQQMFAEDAMSDRSKNAHANAVEFLLKRIGRIRKTEDGLKALG